MNKIKLDDLKNSILSVLTEFNSSEERREYYRAKNAEKNKQREERRAIRAEIDAATARNMAQQNELPNAGGPNADIAAARVPAPDAYAARAKAIDTLAQDTEFQKRAAAAGVRVGQGTGGGVASYTHKTQAERDAAVQRSTQQLRDEEGNARLPDFENKKWNPETGKYDIPMVGKAGAPIQTASAKTTSDLANAQGSPNSDIAAARAMEAERRGDSGSGRVVNPNGTIDDEGRYSAIQARTQAANQERQASREARPPESAATLAGRRARYGYARNPQTFDDLQKNRIIDQDIERAGPLTGYESPAEFYAGRDRRNYTSDWREADRRTAEDEASEKIIGFNPRGMSQEEVRNRVYQRVKAEQQARIQPGGETYKAAAKAEEAAAATAEGEALLQDRINYRDSVDASRRAREDARKTSSANYPTSPFNPKPIRGEVGRYTNDLKAYEHPLAGRGLQLPPR